jgi:protein-S-isoprenylcysteine O-methyltransferase Ste14
MLTTAATIPLLLIAATMAAYWYRVLRMARKQRTHSGRAANLIPAEPLGRALRILWAPAIITWIGHPIAAMLWTDPPAPLRPLFDPGWARWICAAAVLAGFLITRQCWRRMGKSWRMGIDPAEKTQLVFDGLFAYVRHPIYALSAGMMLATMAALPSPLMLAAGAIHMFLLLWESAREERNLLAVHGDAYEAYRRHVGRIVPRSCRPYEPAGGR